MRGIPDERFVGGERVLLVVDHPNPRFRLASPGNGADGLVNVQEEVGLAIHTVKATSRFQAKETP
jgi:hypothetical protein